jgi:hypothetical protein
MIRRPFFALTAGLALSTAAPLVLAQSSTATLTPTAMTREQVKIERNEFLRSHEWDPDTDNWVLKPGFEAPAGMKTRDEVKAARDEFLRNHRWDTNTSTWVRLKEGPRDLGQMTREQVRAETLEFMRTHEWDTTDEHWVDRAVIKRRKQ